MSIVDAAFQALIAQAAYANLSKGQANKFENTQALIKADLTEAQRNALAAVTVLDTYSDATGANLTVLSINGKTHLAIGGTVPTSAGDIFADFTLAVGAPAVLNAQYAAVKAKVQEWLTSDPPILGAGFTIAGHSLGGYLTGALKNEFPAAGDAYMFNAPAVGGIFGSIGEFFTQAFGFKPAAVEGLYSFHSSEGPSVTAGLGFDQVPATLIQTELGSNPVSAHSISRLADGLALQQRLTELFGKSVAFNNAFEDAASVNVGEALDSPLDALKRLAYGASVAKIGDKRDAFYTALTDPEIAKLAGAQVVSLVGLTASEMVSLAQSDSPEGEAYRRALTVLSPIGTTAGVPTSAYSDEPPEYWQLRAEMLERLNWFNTTEKAAYDTSVVLGAEGNANFQNEARKFTDGSINQTIQQGKEYPNTTRIYFGGAGNDTYTGGGVGDFIFGEGGGDTLNGGAGADFIHGGSNDSSFDTLNGEAGDDRLFGGAGSDFLYGGADTDELHGGKGNDRLEGGTGNDTYFWTTGDGNDTIRESLTTSQSSVDIVKFGSLRSDDVEFTHSYTSLIITNKATKETLTIEYWYTYDTKYRLEQLVFADRTITTAEATELGLLMRGTAASETIQGLDSFNDEILGLGGDDTLWGGSGNDKLLGGDGGDVLIGEAGDDILQGEAGSDQLRGNDGNDTLIGGTGNDYLAGGSGNDTIVYNRGDGRDTIMYEPQQDLATKDDTVVMRGFASTDVIFEAQGYDLAIKDAATGANLIVVESWYANNSIQIIDRIVFSDGYLSAADVSYRGLEIHGTEGADTLNRTYSSSYPAPLRLYGHGGNDLLFGGKSDDYLEGGIGSDTLLGAYGNDTYRYNHGDGFDTIADAGGNDTIVFGGLAVTDVSFQHDATGTYSSSLLIKMNDGSGQVLVQGHYLAASGIENFIFGSTSFSASQIESMLPKKES